MKNRIFITLILIILIGCKNRNSFLSDNTHIKNGIRIDPTNAEPLKLDYIFQKTSFVKLHSDENHLIGNIKKLIVFENRIYILDDNNKIFIYDRKGKFINLIYEHGRGPGEYEIIYNFNIDRYYRQIKFTAVTLNKFMCFDLDGNFVRENKFPSIIYISKMFIENDFYVIWAENSSNLGTSVNVNDDIIFVTKDWDYISSMLPIEDWQKQFKFDVPNAFSFYDEEISFLKPFNDTIYHIEPDTIYPRFIIDFGEYKIPKKLLTSISGKNSYERMISQKRFLDNLINGNYAYFVKNFRENQDCIFFSFNFGKNELNVFYSKTSGKKYISKDFINDIDHIPYSPPIATTDSEFVSILEPADLIEHYKKIKDKYPPEELKTIKQLVDSVSEFDNPILVFAKTKPF